LKNRKKTIKNNFKPKPVIWIGNLYVRFLQDNSQREGKKQKANKEKCKENKYKEPKNVPSNMAD
jgi:hypothetical protein